MRIDFDEIDSTSDEALRRIRAGTAADDMAIVAKSQTAGRGRRGRTWKSPPGNLYMTLVFPAPALDRIGETAFVAALAAGEAISSALPGDARITFKWPNDILLGGKKLAGILIESELDPSGRRWCAIGIGVNVEHAPKDLPATSLMEAGAELTPDALVEPLRIAFAGWYRRWTEQGFEPVRANWLAAAAA
jgi:BirA family biotin operon repressor/biotin-[acetyl-CoA-carboxylase] ligase